MTPYDPTDALRRHSAVSDGAGLSFRGSRTRLAERGKMKKIMTKPGLANYKIVLYKQESGGWVAEIPAIGGCYALMETREEALKELEKVFRMIQEEYAESGKPLPAGRAELLVHA